MERQNFKANDSFHVGDYLDDIPDFYKYISMLNSRKEHGKSGRLLQTFLDIIRGLEFGAIQSKPYLADAFRLFAANCMAIGEVSKANQLCKEGLQRFPESVELQLYYGHCLTRLHQFEAAEKNLLQITEIDTSSFSDPASSCFYSFRKSTALGELYQRWDKYEKARKNFEAALGFHSDWFPAHVGLIELEIARNDIVEAGRYLEKVMVKLGSQPILILAAAHLALISLKFNEADDLVAQIQGKLLEDDRFEYLLFLIDFFKGDRESLINVPYLLKGESVETEAARAWLLHLKGEDYKKDHSRIPENTWREEYDELDAAWQQIESRV